LRDPSLGRPQALPVLQQRFPIQRARMRLKLSVPIEAQGALLDDLDARGAMLESSDARGGTFTVLVQVDPGVFRELHTSVQQGAARGMGRIEVVSFAVLAEGATAEEFGASSAAHAARELAGLSLAAGSTGAAQQLEPPGATTSGPDHAVRKGAAGAEGGQAPGVGEVVYRGGIAGIPEAHAQRRERFAELDGLQPGGCRGVGNV
jgi:ribosome maturation protein SDO1